MSICIEKVEYAYSHKIIYFVVRATNICGNIERIRYEANNEDEVHKIIDHYLHASDHNLEHYKNCPWCRENLKKVCE
jgi:hypothetical protein